MAEFFAKTDDPGLATLGGTDAADLPLDERVSLFDGECGTQTNVYIFFIRGLSMVRGRLKKIMFVVPLFELLYALQYHDFFESKTNI